MIYTWCEQNSSAAITTIAQYSTEYLDSVALNCNCNELHKMLYLPISYSCKVAHQEILIRNCENQLQNINWTISTRTDAAPIF